MTFSRWLFALGIALLLLVVGLVAGFWWYLNAPNEIDSAELAPANTIFFASIPNAAKILEGYAGSHAKTLVEDPNSQPLRDAIVNLIGTKNVDLLEALAPNLSGQSFIAVTQFEYDHPEKIGLIAAMKPKAGLGNFDSFLEKLKATFPEVIKQGTTGTGSVEGVDYQWIRGPSALDKICVAKVDGWIVTSWGEASLQDWIQRYRKKSTTSSLVKDVNYQKAVVPVGDDPMTLVYVNCHLVMDIAQKEMTKTNPALADYLAKKFESVGSAALGTRFENGEIVDRFAFIVPRPVQLECGMDMSPCQFETLNFTGPDTRFYWASCINWQQFYKHLKDHPGPSSLRNDATNPVATTLLNALQTWVHDAGLDTKRNIVDALGPELSLQVDWPADQAWPTAGLFIKLNNPDDFKPTVTAIIDSVRKAYSTSGVIQELSSGGHNFAALQFVQSSAFTPTITESGSYLGVFLTENQAVRSFQREPTTMLTHRADFNAHVGDRRSGAAALCYLDTPPLLDRAYHVAMPFISMAGMMNKQIGSMLQGKTLPDDLSWLAPMGTWTCIVSPDEAGIQAYSTSGIGNQGISLAGALGAGSNLLQSMGYLPKIEGSPWLAGLAPNSKDSAPPTSVTGVAPAGANDSPTTSIIIITSNSKIVLDEVTVPEEQIGDVLKSKRDANPNLKITVRVDRDALPDVLSRVMDAGASAGFGVLPYSYSPAPPPPETNSDSTVTPPPTTAPAPMPDAGLSTNAASSLTNAVPPITHVVPETSGSPAH